MFDEHKNQDAETAYRNALQRDATLVSARHNLALVLFTDKNRQPEAIDQWRQAIQQSPDFLAARLSLADALTETGDTAGAIDQYRQVLARKPDYPAAHIALAGLLNKNGHPDAALAELRTASAASPQNPAIFEQIGDIEAARTRTAEARSAYQSALGLKPDKATTSVSSTVCATT